jgi:hypothetical protein
MAIEPAHMSGADEPVPSREVVPTKNTGRPKRPTGPRTARGKRASSKNATRHDQPTNSLAEGLTCADTSGQPLGDTTGHESDTRGWQRLRFRRRYRQPW